MGRWASVPSYYTIGRDIDKDTAARFKMEYTDDRKKNP
jgi:hypothetical protein